MTEKEIQEMMTKLDTLEDERSRMELLSQVGVQRNELLGVLLKYLDSGSSKEVQAAAIYLIGQHRLSDGVQDLVQQIDFDTGGQPRKGPLPLWERYPAMEALIRIGLPAIAPLMELLATEKNDLRRDLAVKVIRYVYGEEIARYILMQPQQDVLTRLDKLPRARG